MADRHETTGKFLPGNKASPGRPSKAAEENLAEVRAMALAIVNQTVTPEDWQAVVLKQLDLAKQGDWRAVSFIAGYYAGQPESTVNLRLQNQSQAIEIQPTDYRESLKALAPVDDDEESNGHE